jgi:hypothetical protein
VFSPLLPFKDIVRSSTCFVTYPLNGVDRFSILPTARVLKHPVTAVGGKNVKTPSNNMQYLCSSDRTVYVLSLHLLSVF